MKRFNGRLWGGLLIIVIAALSYFLFFSRFPVTRDVPWVAYLLFAGGAALVVSGWRRAPRKIVASLVAVLGIFLIGAFVFLVTVFSKQLPAAANAPAIGQKAPDFALPDTNGKVVRLSEVLPTSNGVLLVFYRGYW